MDIDDKQRLWSKYYLTHSTQQDNLRSLSEFVRLEVNQLHLPEKACQDKKRKVLKNMLKYLSRKHILQKYCGYTKISRESDKSKNELIDRLIRYV